MTLSMEAILSMQAIFFILWSLSIYLGKKLINDIEMRLKQNETDIKEIKENYIRRFEKISDKLNETEKILIDKINKTQLEIITEISKLKNADH